MNTTRRRMLAGGAALLTGVAGCTGQPDPNETEPDGEQTGDGWAWEGSVPIEHVTQHHQPSCGCCSEYVGYLEVHGIDVSVEPESDFDAFVETKTELGVPSSMRSCHTIEFGDYVVEGHVPLEAIGRLFETNASIYGIAIPGMPQHAPGMGPPGEEPLTVYAFDQRGETSEFLDIDREPPSHS